MSCNLLRPNNEDRLVRCALRGPSAPLNVRGTTSALAPEVSCTSPLLTNSSVKTGGDGRDTIDGSHWALQAKLLCCCHYLSSLAGTHRDFVMGCPTTLANAGISKSRSAFYLGSAAPCVRGHARQ